MVSVRRGRRNVGLGQAAASPGNRGWADCPSVTGSIAPSRWDVASRSWGHTWLPHGGGEMMVLVGYASEHGSTGDIAQRIAARLSDGERRVEVLALDRVGDLGRYEAVVFGSAIHDQEWLPLATRFIRRNLDALATRPVWLFSVGLPGALPVPLRRLAMEESTVIADFRDAIGPRDHRLFTGVVDRNQLSFVGRLLFRTLGGRYGDFRDWTEIDAWADNIAHQLTVATEAE